MKLKFACSILALAAVILGWALPAGALIKLELTIADVYQKQSKVVLIGKVASVNADTKVVDVAVTEVVKGTSPGEKLRVQITTPPELIKNVAVDQPIVFFIGETAGAGLAVIHVADTWLLVNGVAGTGLKVWRVAQVHNELKLAFPGRTNGVAKLTADLKAGKSTFLNEWKQKPLSGGVKAGPKLPIQAPTWVLAADFNGDKKIDLVVGSAGGTRLMLGAGDGYQDASDAWGPLGQAGNYHAAADVDGNGKIDLLLDDTLYLNQGQKFVAAKSKFGLPKGAALATGLLEATGDQKTDLLLLSAAGELFVYENPGVPDQTWAPKSTQSLWTDPEPAVFAAFGDFGDTGKPHAMVVSKNGITRYSVYKDGGAPADLQRLSGSKTRNSFKGVLGAALHMQKDARIDFLVASESGPVLLLNRGHGTFFLDEAPIEALKSATLSVSHATPCAAADLRGDGIDDLVVLGADGTVFVIDNGHH